MRKFLHRTAAFVVRDFRIATSYKLQFLFRLLGVFFVLATFYFISKLIDHDAANQALAEYDTDYFSFVLIGVAANGLLLVGLSGFAEQLRISMTEGSLEAMFATPTRPFWILAMPCLWQFSFEAFKSLVIVAFGVFLFGVDVSGANWFGCVVILVLTLAAYSVFGLLSAGIIMIVKRGDPINWAFAHASGLLAGAYFPIALLPSWLEVISRALPMTYAYHALRMTLLTGAGLGEIWTDVLVLLCFTLVGLPIAIGVCQVAVVIAKREGTLGTF